MTALLHTLSLCSLILKFIRFILDLCEFPQNKHVEWEREKAILCGKYDFSMFEFLFCYSHQQPAQRYVCRPFVVCDVLRELIEGSEIER